MDNHFLQGDCLPWELPSLPWGGDCSPSQEGGGEGGGKLALRQSERQGGGSWIEAPPPQVPGGRLHSSLVSHLPAQRHPLPRAELRENESRRPVSGLLPFCCGSPLFVRETPVSSWRIPTSVHLLQSQEQRIFLVLVLPLTRSETLGKSLTLLEVNFPHW